MMRHSFFRNNRSPVAVRGEVGVPLGGEGDDVSTDGMGWTKTGGDFFCYPSLIVGMFHVKAPD